MEPSQLIAFALAILALSALSALFSALETALFSLTAPEIERLKKRGLAALGQVMENPRRLLSAILLGDALVNIPLILLCLYVGERAVTEDWPFWGSALIIFGIVVFLCDLVPKLLGIAAPTRIVPLGVWVMRVLLPVLEPVTRRLQALADGLADKLTPASLKPNASLSEEELGTLVELSEEGGALHASESTMISEIIKLGDKTARDCMTPRVDMFAVADDTTHEKLIPLLRQRRYRRVPVYGETPDDILGVLHVENFLARPGLHFTELLMPPSFVAETMKAADLLKSFLSHPQGIAFVVDEHGGIEGVVTMSDLIEEIISDAVPAGERSLYLEPSGEGRLLASGQARLDDLSEMLGTDITAPGIDTVSGLIFNRLGAMPKPGARVDVGAVLFTIRRTSRKRIEEVLVEYDPEDYDVAEEEGA